MLRIECPCGEVFHAAEHHGGSYLRCGRCARIVAIGRPQTDQLRDHSEQLAYDSPDQVAGTQVSGRSRQRTRRSALWLGLTGAMLVAVGIVVGIGLRTRAFNPWSAPPSTATPLIAPRVPRALPAPQPRTLTNGTVVYRGPSVEGRGELTVTNGTPRDAIVSLIEAAPAGRERVAVYVRTGHTAVVRGIAVGTYRLHFALGTDWTGDTFAREPEDFEFIEPLVFREEMTSTDRRHEYAQWSITLHPVPGGTARIVRVPQRPLVPDLDPGSAASEESPSSEPRGDRWSL